MSRFIHDQFAKDILDELLSYIGGVTPDKRVPSEAREIDIYFTPNPDKVSYSDYRTKLGLLGKMAGTPALFEPFRNGVTVNDMRSCLSKLLDTTAKQERESKRKDTKLSPEDLPFLWILTPTASETFVNGFNTKNDPEKWGSGIYLLGEYLRTAIVVIHKLPKTPETLWLRILGRDKVQRDAMASLAALPLDDPWRVNALELVYLLQSNLDRNREKKSELETEEDIQLIMAIAPLFQQQLAAAELRGEQRGEKRGEKRGIERGRIEENRYILENFLRVRLGDSDRVLSSFIPPISTLPALEFTMLLVQLATVSVDNNGVGEARRLMAETVLRMCFGELDERLTSIIPSLLALSPEDLGLLVSQLPQLSVEELLGRFDNSVS